MREARRTIRKLTQEMARSICTTCTFCFGDSSNDSDLFDVCDEKYAVENADDWLKAKATGVIGYCEEDGVAKWLDEHAGL